MRWQAVARRSGCGVGWCLGRPLTQWRCRPLFAGLWLGLDRGELGLAAKLPVEFFQVNPSASSLGFGVQRFLSRFDGIQQNVLNGNALRRFGATFDFRLCLVLDWNAATSELRRDGC